MKLTNAIFWWIMCALLAITIIEGKPNYVEEDDDSSPEIYDAISRVSIKVYRGADREENGKIYVPWGVWIRQPSGK